MRASRAGEAFSQLPAWGLGPFLVPLRLSVPPPHSVATFRSTETRNDETLKKIAGTGGRRS